MTMEFKIRANIIMSRNLTIEADNLKEAMEKVKDMMAKPFASNELMPRKIYYDVISPSAT